MMRKIFLVSFLALIYGASAIFSQAQTSISDKQATKMLLGKHKLSLQWISWDYYGSASVRNKGGTYYLKGKQKSRENSNYLSIDGIITAIGKKEFKFTGKIITQIDYINGGKACEREGNFTFRIAGKRKYWRMQEINNPCDEVADYVDIFLR